MIDETTSLADIDWIVADTPVEYPDALAWMDARSAAVATGSARECVWLLEHPALYTAGTSSVSAELIDARFPVFISGRGGRYTYHGPGQRVVYLILDLNKRGRDVRAFVHGVEGWIIATLVRFGIDARREAGRIGIWTDDPDRSEAKIAAIGIRVRRWVSMHGFAINVAPNLTHFTGIVPCGISDFGVTSLARLGMSVSLADVDAALFAEFPAFLTALYPSQSA